MGRKFKEVDEDDAPDCKRSIHREIVWTLYPPFNFSYIYCWKLPTRDTNFSYFQFLRFFFQHCTKQYDITFESHWSHRKKLYREQWQWQNKVKDRSKDLVAKNRDFWKTTFFLRNIIHKSFYNNKKLNTQIYKKVEQKTTFIADNNGLIIIIITDLSV